MRWLASYLLVIAAACGTPAGQGGPDGAAGGHDSGNQDDGGGDGGGGGTDGGGGGSDGGGSNDDGGGGGTDGGGGGGSDGGTGGGTSTSQLCGQHTWNAAVPASGTSIMAYRTKAYLFGSGTQWTIIENSSATIGAIPLPSGITSMTGVVVEMAPSGRPFVTFTDQNQRYGAFFDGTGFVKVTALGQASAAHADAAEKIYALSANGLTEYAQGASPVIRGAFPYANPPAWTVAADGTVYVIRSANRPSTIHPGDQANTLRAIRLRPNTLSWTDEVEIGSNEGWGFSTVKVAAAPDGSLHVAYVPLGIYFRSHDGQSWQTENLISFHEKATLIDTVPSGSSIQEDVAAVKGSLYTLAAQDYDHVSAVFTYNGGSFSYPSYYYLRRCPPFDPTFPAWPAERFAMSGTAWGPTPVAINERGMASILTPTGVRQDVP